MIARQNYNLFEDEPCVAEADYLNPETRTEAACRLWAGFAITSILLSFTAVSLFGPVAAPEQNTAALVTPAQANLSEASVTPTQVDIRISQAIGTLENRLDLLEKTRLINNRKMLDTHFPQWNRSFEDHDLPSLNTGAVSSARRIENAAITETGSIKSAPEKNTEPEPQNSFSILSHLVKTQEIRDVPHAFLPLPYETGVSQP